MSAKRLGSRLIMKYQGKTYESAWLEKNKAEQTAVVVDALRGAYAYEFKTEQGGRVIVGQEVLRRAVFIVKECYEPCGDQVPAASEAEKEEGK